MSHKKSCISNTYAFLPDTRLLLISVISLAYFSASAGCAQKREKIASLVENSPEITVSVIDINTASRAELEKLPGIGAQIGRRVVEHREKYGRFRRAEHLILVPGMSDKKFRQIRSLITAK